MLFTSIYSTSYTNYAHWNCSTVSGAVSGQPCIFPFKTRGGWDKPWGAEDPPIIQNYGSDVRHVR